jgi:flagellar secretion chaperone FliS
MTMNHKSAAQAYQQSSIENAPPVKIVRLLYEGALRYIDRAAACDPKKERLAFRDWIGRANAVVAELRIALEPDPDPDLADKLERLYEFAQFQFTQALLREDIQPLAQARKALATLLEGWKHIELETTGSST